MPQGGLRPLPRVKEYRYDQRGRRTAELEYFASYRYLKDVAGNAVVDTSGLDTNGYPYATLIHYDRADHPTQYFFLHTSELLNARTAARADSFVAASPDDLGEMLVRRLRYSAVPPPTGLLPPEPDTDTMSAEEEEAYEEARERREELDYSLSEFYTDNNSPFVAFVGQRYDPQGRMVSRVHFLRYQLARRDTFVYDVVGKLTRWETWSFMVDHGYAAPQENGWWPRRQSGHQVRTYSFTDAGRVARCIYRSELQRQGETPAFDFLWEQTDAFGYDAHGRVSGIRRNLRASEDGWRNPDAPLGLRDEVTEYAVEYETY